MASEKDKAVLCGAKLDRAKLYRVVLWCADLTEVSMKRAKIIQCSFYCSNMAKINLRGSIIKLTDLSSTNLGGANLRDVKFIWPNLDYAHVEGADLRGADLRKVSFSFFSATGAIYDKTTKWPRGYSPTSAILASKIRTKNSEREK